MVARGTRVSTGPAADVNLLAVAQAQMIEAQARLVLATSRCTDAHTDLIERITCQINNIAYELEHAVTHGKD